MNAASREIAPMLSLARLVVVAAVVAGAAVSAASEPDYPFKPIRIVVGASPGGGADTVARVVAHKLGESLGQQVVVDNRPGGGGVIASEIAAKAPPDGHTLYLVTIAFTAAPSLQRTLPYDTLRDFAAITRLAVAPGALIVHPSLPVDSVRDLIAFAKAKPGQITFGSGGIGSASHLGGELFKLLAGVDMMHVPYKGSALVATSLLSGETAVAFSNPVSYSPHVKAGRLRMLAVTTTERWPLLPDLPAIAEAGVRGYELLIWQGMVAPAATPPHIIARLHRELSRIMQVPETAERLGADGSRPMTETPQQFAAFLASEIAKWAKVAKAAGIAAR